MSGGKKRNRRSVGSWLRMLFRFVLSLLPRSARHELFRSQIRLNYSPPDELIVKLAETEGEFRAAFTVLHDSYVRSGFMKPHRSGMRITKYHALPTTSTFIVKWAGEVVATMSLIRDNPLGLPMDSSFDLSDLRKGGNRLAEVSSLAVHPDFRGNHGEILLPLLKYFIAYTTQYYGVDYVVAAINPRRVDFYEGMLLFSRLTQKVVGEYDFANGAPAVGLYHEVAPAQHRFAAYYGMKSKGRSLYHYFYGTDVGESSAFANLLLPARRFFKVNDAAMTPQMLQTFFGVESDVFAELSPAELGEVVEMYQSDEHRSAICEVLSEGRKLMPLNVRRSYRHHVKCEAEIEIRGRYFYPTVLDSAERGLRIKVDDDLPKGGVMILRIRVGPFDVSSLTGEVVWSSSGTAGIRILKADRTWDEFIAYLDQELSRGTNSNTDFLVREAQATYAVAAVRKV